MQYFITGTAQDGKGRHRTAQDAEKAGAQSNNVEVETLAINMRATSTSFP